MKIYRNNRGFSLVEIVITLAVITIVSIAIMSTVLQGRKVQIKVETDRELRIFASNALEAFKSAEADPERMNGILTDICDPEKYSYYENAATFEYICGNGFVSVEVDGDAFTAEVYRGDPDDDKADTLLYDIGFPQKPEEQEAGS